jgi:hypothetical protein
MPSVLCDLVDSCHLLVGLAQMLANLAKVFFIFRKMDEIADCF